MTMQHPENYPNTQRGATRETRRTLSTRAILKAWMDEVDNPHSNDERSKLLKQFLEFMHTAKGKQHLDAVAEYWFTNHFRALLTDYPEPGEAASKRADARQAAQIVREQKTAELTQRVTKAIDAKAIILLDLVMTNGKVLRDCTGKDLRQMPKMDGLVQRLIERVKPTQKVGDVLKEADVQRLYQE